MEGPAVDLGHLRGRDGIGRGIEAGEIAEQVAERVADLPVGLGVPVEDLLREAHVLEEVDHRDPQAQDLGAALVGRRRAAR